MIRELLRKTTFGRKILIPFLRNIIHEVLTQTFGTDLRFQRQLKASQETVEYIEKHLIEAKDFSNRYDLFRFAVESVAVDGLYLEFGVYKGDSINFIAEQISKEIHGFDSFDGLPEFWETGYEKGSLAIKDKGSLKFKKNVAIEVGLIEDTLPKFVETHKEKVAFLHIDVDLYSSTKTVFKNLKEQIIKGTIVIFDEYFNFPSWQVHEFKAFQEFCAENQIKYEYIAFNSFSGQVALKIL